MKKMFPRHSRDIEINTTNMILDICTTTYMIKVLQKSLWLLVVIE